jgi:hypothetical protein
MSKSRIISQEQKEEIVLLSNKGNDAKFIASFTQVPLKVVQHVIKNSKKVHLPDEFKTDFQVHRETIEEFERILKDKKSGVEKGKQLWEHMEGLHEDYKRSWEADSSIQLNFKNRYIAIAFIADFHIGHEGVDYKRLKYDMSVLAHTDNMYAMFLGDSIDNFIDPVKHPEAVINAVSPPKHQLYMLQHLLHTFKNPGEKLLLVTKDNHVTERLKKACGIDWSNKLWDDYNIFYGGEEIIATLNVGKTQYKFAVRHRYRGGSKNNLTMGCKNLLKEGKYGDVDLIALGHKHEGATEIFHYRGIPRVAVQASTYKLFDPYAKKLGFDDPNVFMPCVILCPDRKDFMLCTSLQAGRELLLALNK